MTLWADYGRSVHQLTSSTVSGTEFIIEGFPEGRCGLLALDWFDYLRAFLEIVAGFTVFYCGCKSYTGVVCRAA